MAGKGDRLRPMDRERFGANWERIFGKREALDELVAEPERLGLYGGEQQSSDSSREYSRDSSRDDGKSNVQDTLTVNAHGNLTDVTVHDGGSTPSTSTDFEIDWSND